MKSEKIETTDIVWTIGTNKTIQNRDPLHQKINSLEGRGHKYIAQYYITINHEILRKMQQYVLYRNKPDQSKYLGSLL